VGCAFARGRPPLRAQSGRGLSRRRVRRRTRARARASARSS
jgi:hypothetical protein